LGLIILLQLFDFYEVNNLSNYNRIFQEHRSLSSVSVIRLRQLTDDGDGFDYCNVDDNDIKNDLRRRSIMSE